MTGIAISQQSDVPIYRQLYIQISSRILNGKLKSDFNLPPIRTAAKELRVSIITVKKAWEELERSGLIYSVTGKGCFISDLSQTALQKQKDDIVRQQMNKDIVYYKTMGITKTQMINLIEDMY